MHSFGHLFKDAADRLSEGLSDYVFLSSLGSLRSKASTRGMSGPTDCRTAARNLALFSGAHIGEIY